MLKLLGAGLLLGGGLAAGLGAAGVLARRAAALEAWEDALGLLNAELAFRLPAMPELLETLSRKAAEPAGAAFAAGAAGLSRLGEEPFEDIWNKALVQTGGALSEEDLEVLFRLGAVLGRYGAEDQRQAVEVVRRELGERAREAREELRQKGRAYGTLGLAAGAGGVILLL